MIATRGRLREIRLQADSLEIAGTAAPVESGAITGFRAWLGGRPLDLAPLDRDAAPAARDAAAERFALVAPLEPEVAARAANELVTVQPQVDGADGYRLLGVARPEIPLPQVADLEAIFGVPQNERTRQAVHAAWPVGFEYVGYCIDLAGLEPDGRVLEVGCGMGRLACALSYYLSRRGSYAGFDPMPGPIRWAQETIAVRFPNFAFTAVDVRNDAYHPGGADAARLVFPHDSGRADLVILLSVFTHLQAPAVRRYLSEIHRVLRPGARCLCTWYLLNDESEALLAEGRSREAFSHPIEEGLAQDARTPEHLLAFREPAVLQWVAESGLHIDRLARGRWCGRRTHLSYQDIMVLRK